MDNLEQPIPSIPKKRPGVIWVVIVVVLIALASGNYLLRHTYLTGADVLLGTVNTCPNSAAAAKQATLKITNSPTLTTPGTLTLTTTKCQQNRYKSVTLVSDKAILLKPSIDLTSQNGLPPTLTASIDLNGWGTIATITPKFIPKDTVSLAPDVTSEDGNTVTVSSPGLTLPDTTGPIVSTAYNNKVVVSGFCLPDQCIYLLNALPAFSDRESTDTGLLEIRYRIDKVTDTDANFLTSPNLSTTDFYSQDNKTPLYSQKDDLAFLPVKNLEPNAEYVMRAIAYDVTLNPSVVTPPFRFKTDVFAKHTVERASGDVNGDGIVNQQDIDALKQAIIDPTNPVNNGSMLNYAGDIDQDHKLTLIDLNLLQKQVK